MPAPPLLPSNFLSYAGIVSKMFKEIENYCKKRNEPVEALYYSLFSARLEKWFNNTYLSQFNVRCCKHWWHSQDGKGYIDKVHDLAFANSNGEITKTFFRLISVDKEAYMKDTDTSYPKPSELCIFTKNGTPVSLDYNTLIYGGGYSTSGRNDHFYHGIKLIKNLIPSRGDIKSLKNSVTVFPIGYVPEAGKEIPFPWRRLDECFQKYYHSISECNPDDNLHKHDKDKDNEIETLWPGVHFRYIDKTCLESDMLLRSEDFFCVELRYEGGKKEAPFAIIFKQNEENDTSGIKLLNTFETKELLEHFKQTWKAHGTCQLSDILI